MQESQLIRILPACLTAPLPKGWDDTPPGYSIELMPMVDRPEAVTISLSTTEPDILLLDADFAGFDAFALTEQVLQARPGVAVVIMSQDSSPDRLRRAMLGGAEEYLIKPLEAQAVRDSVLNIAAHRTLRVVKEPEPEETALPEAAGMVVAIVSGKGGLGKTTIACNLAALIARTAGRTAGLVGLESGDGGVLLSLQPRLGLMDMAAAVGEDEAAYSPEWLQQFGAKHPSGLTYWTWQGSSTKPAEAMPDDFLPNLFDTCRRFASLTLVDFPLLSADEAATVLPLVDVIVLVSSSSDLLALRATKTFLDMIAPELAPRVRIVINRSDPSDMISREDFQHTLGQKIAAVLPNEPSIAAPAINMGSPFIITQPQSELASTVRGLGQTLFKLPTGDEQSRPKKRFMLF